MALITCPECGKEISDKAKECINCGFPIRENLEEVETRDQEEFEGFTIAERIQPQHNTSNEKEPQTKEGLKWKPVLIVVAIIAVLFYPDVKNYFVNSDPLDVTEILGKWGPEEITFGSDFTANVSNNHYVTGVWEIVSEEQKTIRLWYTATDYQVDRFNEEHSYEMEGYIATREDILEWELESDTLPPEGIYRFNREENSLYCEEYEYKLHKDY